MMPAKQPEQQKIDKATSPPPEAAKGRTAPARRKPPKGRPIVSLCLAAGILLALGAAGYLTSKAETKNPELTPATLSDPPSQAVEGPTEASSPALNQWLQQTTLGPLRLGMTAEEVQEQLGEPQSKSNSGEITLPDGSKRINWFYRFPGETEYLCNASLGFADVEMCIRDRSRSVGSNPTSSAT